MENVLLVSFTLPSILGFLGRTIPEVYISITAGMLFIVLGVSFYGYVQVRKQERLPEKWSPATLWGPFFIQNSILGTLVWSSLVFGVGWPLIFLLIVIGVCMGVFIVIVMLILGVVAWAYGQLEGLLQSLIKKFD